MKQHVLWLVLLVALCGYYMANQESLGTQPATFFPRGPALGMDDVLLGESRTDVDRRLKPGAAETDLLGWVAYPQGLRVAFRDERAFALEGRHLQQGPRVLVSVGDSQRQVESALGSWVELPYWAPKTSKFYLQDRAEVIYSEDGHVLLLRVYSEEALNLLRTGP